MAGSKRSFGQISKLPSGRYRARYTGPDTRLYNAPVTFDAKVDAEAWLTDERRLISAGTWDPPPARKVDCVTKTTFGEYADAWLTQRSLKPRTRAHYRMLLERHVRPTFGDAELAAITPASVRVWHAHLDSQRPTLKSHAYGLLRTILQTATQDGDLVANPCHIRGAGTTKRAKKIRPASLDELETLVEAIAPRYRLLILLAAWCALRFGEITELRRRDVDLANGVLRVRRGVVRIEGEVIVGTPKSEAGIRDVSVPAPLVELLREHLRLNTAPGRDGLLFPATDGVSHLAPSSLYRVYYRARNVAGRPDLRFHDLRHTGAVLAAQTGATLADLMGRLGHSTPGAAMRYQHTAAARDAAIADALAILMTAERG